MSTEHHHEFLRIRERMSQHPKGVHRSVYEVDQDVLTRGDRLADKITTVLGSWKFILIQSSVLCIWLVVNSIAWLLQWDPYPFILLNLVLSFQAAFTAPVIMMSQNRQAARDRIASELDFEVNRVAGKEVEAIQTRLDELTSQQWDSLLENLAEHRALLEAVHQRTSRIEQILGESQEPRNPV